MSKSITVVPHWRASVVVNVATPVTVAKARMLPAYALRRAAALVCDTPFRRPLTHAARVPCTTLACAHRLSVRS